MTNTTNTPDHLNILIAALKYSLESAPPPLANEPDFAEYLDNQALLQQLNLAQHFQMCLDIDPTNQVAAANFLKALALVERSRTRISRPTKHDSTESQSLPRERHERDDAREFLKGELDIGPHPARMIVDRARSLGISVATLRRAKASLNVVSTIHVLHDRTRFWFWALPGDPLPSQLSPDSAVEAPSAFAPAS